MKEVKNYFSFRMKDLKVLKRYEIYIDLVDNVPILCKKIKYSKENNY